jgi:formate hydrogenlyase subunit 3/multisubunit Na+/H+ antiporter MnhD subunit
MKSKIGEIILILGVLLFVFGAIGILTNSLPQNTLQAMGVFALIFVGIGLSLKKRVKK